MSVEELKSRQHEKYLSLNFNLKVKFAYSLSSIEWFWRIQT